MPPEQLAARLWPGAELDVDYVAWATQHFDRMLRTADEAGVRATGA